MHDGNAVGLVELAGHLGNQFVGCNAHRAGEASGFKNTFLNEPGQNSAAFALAARHLREVDVHLVHTAVFHEGCDVGDDAFEDSGVVAVLVKVDGQQNGLGTQLGRFHEAHGGANAKLPRRISCGGNDPAACVALDAREKIKRNFRKIVRRPLIVWVCRAQSPQQVIFFAPATANDHRQALQLGVAQQLDRRVKRVHVEVGNSSFE